MILDKLFLSAPALVLLSSTAWTQTPAPFQYWSQNRIEWPTADLGGCADLTRSVCGDLTGDLVKDVVVLGGGQACLLFGPYGHASVMQVPFGETVNDIDIMPSGSSTLRDGLVGVGAFGLSQLTFSDSVQTFLSTPPVLGNWVGAKIVRSRNINNDGPADFVGVASDSKTVIVRQNTPGTNNYTELTFQCFNNATSSIKDVVLLQWDYDPALEIALLTDYGLEVYEPSGTLARKTPTPGAHGDAIAAFQGPQPGREILAWLVTNSAQTNQNLYAYRGTVLPLLQSQPDLTFTNGVALTAGDADGDGDGDLALSHRGTYAPMLLQNVATIAGETSNNAYFTASAQLALSDPPPAFDLTSELAREASGNDAHVVWDDLDGDDQLDMLVPIEAAGVFAVLRSSKPWEVLQIELGRSETEIYKGGLFNSSPWPLVPTFDLYFADVPADATHIELVAWRQANLSTSSWLEPTEVISRRYDVVHNGHHFYHIAVPMPVGETSACGLNKVYWFDLRFTKRDGTLALTDAWPSHYAMVSTDEDALEYWKHHPQDSAFMDFDSDCAGGQVPVNASGIEKRALPPTQTGNVPHVPINPPPGSGSSTTSSN